MHHILIFHLNYLSKGLNASPMNYLQNSAKLDFQPFSIFWGRFPNQRNVSFSKNRLSTVWWAGLKRKKKERFCTYVVQTHFFQDCLFRLGNLRGEIGRGESVTLCRKFFFLSLETSPIKNCWETVTKIIFNRKFFWFGKK